MPIQTLTVDGNGNTISGWAAEGGDFTRVQSDDGDTTRLYSPTNTDVRQFSMSNTSGLSGATINSVTVFASFRSLDPVSNTFQIGVRSGGTDYWSANKDTVASTAYILFSETWATDPATGVAWTIAGLDALQTGVQKTNGTGGGVTYVYVEVDYIFTPELAQEGFRFRDDDGSESSASWLIAQDTNISRASLTNTRLRVLLNATNDPASSQYQLEYKEDVDSTWQKVLTADAFPVVASSATTADTSLAGGRALNMPSGIAVGDLLIAFCTNDAPGATNMDISGWTQVSAGAYTSNVVKHAIFAKIATGADTGTLTGASQDFSAVVTRITEHGVTTIGTDIKVGTMASTAGTAPNPPNLDAGSSKKWLWMESFGADDDDDTATYWTPGYTAVDQIQSAPGTSSCLTAVAYLHSETQTENPAAMTMDSEEEALAQTIAIPPNTQSILLAASVNIAASGANTTVQLSAPSGKSTSDFVVGRIQDDENPADAVNITSDDYTEMEWCISATAAAEDSQTYQFRVTVSGTPINTYTVTPEWTIGSGGGGRANRLLTLGVG